MVKEIREYIQTRVAGYIQTGITGLFRLEILQRIFLVRDCSKDLLWVLSFLLKIIVSDSVSFMDIPDRRELHANGTRVLAVQE